MRNNEREREKKEREKMREKDSSCTVSLSFSALALFFLVRDYCVVVHHHLFLSFVLVISRSVKNTDDYHYHLHARFYLLTSSLQPESISNKLILVFQGTI